MSRRASILLPQMASTLRKMARRGGERVASLSDLEARILVELHLFGPLTMTSLVEILGNEKSQVSRTLRSLQASNLVDRSTVRSPIALSPAGATLARTIVANAQTDTAKMVADVSEREQSELVALLPRLWTAACALLAEENERQDRKPTPGFARIDYRLMEQTTRIDLLPLRVATLGTLLQRSFFLACRRAAGLPASEAAVLTHIWGHAPIQGDELARLIGRPKAQTDRTAHALIQLGLIHRKRALAHHAWVYDAAPAGDDKWAVLQHELDRREEALLAGLTPCEASDITRILESIHGNICSL
jgi:DNA-binding MarR family transcriptional regulator